MPNLDYVRKSISSYSPSFLPVMVITGGTNGIGEAIAKAFAKYTGGKAHIIIIGRNRSAAEAILATLTKPPTGTDYRHEFVECDLSLMKNVRRTTQELLSRLPEVHYLVLCAGINSWTPRDETAEGVDRRLAIRYYSRFLFIYDLLPLLRKARDAGEDAKVLSVNGSSATAGPALDQDGNLQSPSFYSKMVRRFAGTVATLEISDLGYTKNPTAFKTILAAGIYNDLILDTFADREQGVSFQHIYPGFVRTPGNSTALASLPWHLKPIGLFAQPLINNVLSKEADDCAEFMLYALFQGEAGSFSRSPYGDVTRVAKLTPVSKEPARDKKALWEHSLHITEGQ